MINKKRPLGEALKSSVAAEDDAVRRRFEQADQVLIERTENTKPEPETSKLATPVQSALARKPPENTETSAGVTRLAYSIPADEAAMVENMLLRAARAGHLINRSELVRAALNVLSVMPDRAFEDAVKSVIKLKPGRPSGS